MSLPYRNSKKKRTNSYILIGDGFDEFEVVYFLHKFRQAGLPIKSVSLFDKLVYSRQGVGLKADYSLADKPFDPADEYWLILPSGGRNGDVLRRDVRVKSLLESVNLGNGHVVVTDNDSDLAGDVDRLFTERPSLHPHFDEPLESFVESLTDRVVYAS